jgi:hypothetical protein
VRTIVTGNATEHQILAGWITKQQGLSFGAGAADCVAAGCHMPVSTPVEEAEEAWHQGAVYKDWTAASIAIARSSKVRTVQWVMQMPAHSTNSMQ